LCILFHHKIFKIAGLIFAHGSAKTRGAENWNLKRAFVVVSSDYDFVKFSFPALTQDLRA